jgi:glycosyltransferase involved in cell wall biosynthesis
MAPEFETMLVVGERESHEQSAEYLINDLGINYVTIKGMGRSINPASDYKAYGEMKKLIKEFRPDVVHTHAAKPGAIGRLAAAAEGVPVILHTFHGHVFHSYFSSLKTKFFINTERFLARKSDAIIAISEQQRKELVHDFRIAPETKFHLVPLGFNLDKFKDDQEAKRIRFRNEFGVADDEIAIGIIGRMVPVKNHELFLNAFHHVLKNTNKKVKAFIIGDGDTRPVIEKAATEASILFSTEKSITHPHPLVFTSWRSDVDVINAGLDIIALTSLNEGTPVSLIEAQAANKPIVSTRVGGIGDIVIENETALLADLHDADTFSNHLLQLVNDDTLRFKLGANSRQHVMQRFSYQRLVNDMSALYHQLLQKKKRH